MPKARFTVSTQVKGAHGAALFGGGEHLSVTVRYPWSRYQFARSPDETGGIIATWIQCANESSMTHPVSSSSSTKQCLNPGFNKRSQNRLD